MTTVRPEIARAICDLKELIKRCNGDEEKIIRVLKFGLYVLLLNQDELLNLLSEQPTLRHQLGLRVVPMKDTDLALSELVNLQRELSNGSTTRTNRTADHQTLARTN
jgi:hypothetical protein